MPTEPTTRPPAAAVAANTAASVVNQINALVQSGQRVEAQERVLALRAQANDAALRAALNDQQAAFDLALLRLQAQAAEQALVTAPAASSPTPQPPASSGSPPGHTALYVGAAVLLLGAGGAALWWRARARKTRR